MRPVITVVLLAFLLSVFTSAADAPATANSDPAYRQLRTIGLGTEAISVSEFRFKRDAATFVLRSGTLCFLAPVQGKVTGAVFVGDGVLTIDPPLSIEHATLKILTKENEFSETFSEMVLRFTDTTYDELKSAGGKASASCSPDLLHDTQNALRKNIYLKYNLDGRILQDVLSSQPGGLFVAFIHGKRYSGKEIFAIDREGSPNFVRNVAPEEVQFATYDDRSVGVWAAFHLQDEYKSGAAKGTQVNSTYKIEHQAIDATIEKNAELIGKTTTTLRARKSGVRVVPLDLYSKLRVHRVTDESGQPLNFIQEDKDEDADFYVILNRELAEGEQLRIVTEYSGKDAISNEGGGNYYPVARHNWYPNSRTGLLGDYVSYDLTFRYPKGTTLVATGDRVSESEEGGQKVSIWKSGPQTVAGFNIGRFKMEEAKLANSDFLVQSFANTDPPNWVRSILSANEAELNLDINARKGGQAALGNMNTTPLLKKALSESQYSVALYTEYFGPISNKHLAVTQQTACGYGQAWPNLVWLPICYFFDTTVRHQLGIQFGDRGYWKSVTAHEVAHQWWGHHVGFASYRDQWMSEGFAEFSASLFIQSVENNPKKFIAFWNDQHEMLFEKNKEGYRAIDAGPVTLGYRLSNPKTGAWVANNLIYPKGAYILHMIRMMMWDRKTGDANFKATMHDFVSTYANRPATTEDFKAMVEKHMTAEMDVDGNHKMDWFFDAYVYGTAVPAYQFASSFDKNAEGDVVFHFKLTQSNVPAGFRNLIPIYLELADGRIAALGRVRFRGTDVLEQSITLTGVKQPPKRAMINYFSDVLTAN